MGDFDISLKHVVTAFPRDWAVFLGVSPDAPVDLIDTDLSAVQAVADKILAIGGPEPFLLHLEPQGQYDAELDARMLAYAALLYRRHQLPIHTAVLLLDRQARGPAVRGTVSMNSPAGSCALEFRYQVVEVWKIPTETLLQQGLGILPLAPLGTSTLDELPVVLEQMAARFSAETSSGEAAELWTATTLLLGIKYDRDVIRTILQNTRHLMQNSATLKLLREEFLEEGRKEGLEEGLERGIEQGQIALRQSILRIGVRRLGAPPSDVEAMINQEPSMAVLQSWLDCIIEATSWDVLRSGPR